MAVDGLAGRTAPVIVEALDSYEHGFQELTRRARGRFEQRDWKGALADSTERLDLYGEVVTQLEEQVRTMLREREGDRQLWAAIKPVYTAHVAGRPDWELAETFFNSVTRRVFATAGVDPSIEYVDSDFDPPPHEAAQRLSRTYQNPDLAALLESVLCDAWFGARFEDARRDAQRAAAKLHEFGIRGDRAEILGAPFFRRKGAYLVGRLFHGSRPVPLVLALLNTEGGIVVDAVITDEDDVSIVFSFTRSHFNVDLAPPHQVVQYLKQLMPRKPVAELYIALGYHKHGKTELYRDLLHRLRESEDRFEFAPGTPGMVMVVFTMPGYDVVFKVIRDRFPAIKLVTPAAVRKNYRLVFRHDRAGRLVEAQEFEHLKFDRARFEPRLLEEFGRQADRTVDVAGEEVVVHHAYLERRVTPLDVYLEQSNAEAAGAAVIDFGQAVKDLAANGIFPGELLPKNFGVTRHGRVVCYDYDELGLLTDFDFRSMPAAQAPEDDLGDEAWFGVGSRDAFPEEFRRFIGLPPELLKVLDQHHGDLYEASFWQEMQRRVRHGEIIDIFPYPASRRLAPPGPSLRGMGEEDP